MAKRLSAEARIMALYETLSPEAARIVFDLLRLKQPSKKAASKKDNDFADSVKLVRQNTGASIATCKDTLKRANGNVDLAIQVLQREQPANV